MRLMNVNRDRSRCSKSLPKSMLLALLLVALVAGVVAAPSFGQSAGMVCDVPAFDLVLQSPFQSTLVVKVESEGYFEFQLQGTTDGQRSQPIDVMVPPHLRASSAPMADRRFHVLPGTLEIPVELGGFDFYLDNVLSVTFESFDELMRKREPAEGETVEEAEEADRKWTEHMQEQGKVCAARRQGQAYLIAFEKQLLKIDAGTVFSRNKDDGFDGALELALIATSRWTRSITGVVDIRLSEIAAIKETPPPDEEMMMPEAETAMPEMPAAPEIFNPFAEGGSIVRGNAYAVYYPKSTIKGNPLYPPSFGLVGGIGFSTFSGGSGSSVEAKERYFYGARWQVNSYNRKLDPVNFGGTTGFVQFGMARDDIWQFEESIDADGDPSTDPEVVQRDERDRYFFEAQLEFPRLGNETARLATRLFADIPKSGDGPSDIRISVLAAIDLKSLRKTITGN